MKSLLLISAASVLCIGAVAQDVRDFRDHNYSSVDQCVKIRTERTASLNKRAAEGDPTSSPAILARELSEQDPSKCVHVFLGCDETEAEKVLTELDTVPPGSAFDMFRSHHRRQVQQFTSVGGSRGCSPKQIEALTATARLRKAGASPEQLAEALIQLDTARQQHLRERVAWEEGQRRQEAQRERQLAQSTKQAVERRNACVQRNGLSKAGTVKIGMTAADARICGWGNPSDINRTTGSWGTHEQWVYGTRNYLYFENGILRSIQN
jgi:DNA-binding transcriptional MerR regulator